VNHSADDKLIERQLLDELISRLAPLGYPHPTDIRDRESPDFSMIVSGESIGVEVTRGTFEEYCRAGRQLSDEVMIFDRLRDYGLSRSTKELIADATDFSSKWFSVPERMRDWHGKIENPLVIKRQKLNRVFEKFPQNWLLIYDFPSLLNDEISYKLAMFYLNALFTQPREGIDFDTVFILSYHYLFRWRDKKLDFNYYTG
jgi:hypothetical protein